jgi:hypothetical protein
MITNSDSAANLEHQLGFCVNPGQQNRPIASAKHISSQGCKHTLQIEVLESNIPDFTIISDYASSY